MSILKPTWQTEGNGAIVLRMIGSQIFRNFDPFLLFDMAKIKLPAGFPQHPHRGFDTVLYNIKGGFYHQDFKGHEGKSATGDVSWMTAGRGIVHIEIPASFQEESVGFQLWINLRSTNKMDPPSYQTFANEKIKVVAKDKAQVKIICGKWQGHTGPVISKTPVYYFDIKIHPQGKFQLPITGNWNSLVFPYEGDLIYQQDVYVKQQESCILHQGQNSADMLHRFRSQHGCRFLLIAGQPLKELIERQGPFVMNTKDEIQQAYKDYKDGANGFEGAPGWLPKIKGLLAGKKYEEL